MVAVPKKLSSLPRAMRGAEAQHLLPSPKPRLLLQPPLPRSNSGSTPPSAKPNYVFSALLSRARENPAVTGVILASMALGGSIFVSSPAMAATHSPEVNLDLERLPVADLNVEAPEIKLPNLLDVDMPSQPEDANTRELREKVSKLVNQKFQGNYAAAFAHYDKGGDGAIDTSELDKLLSDAKVGNFFTRGAWVDGIIEKLDEEQGNHDGKIQWSEFQKALEAATTAVV